MLKENKITKVAVGLSGGVDSSVAAAILKEESYQVTGVHLECWSEPGCGVSQERKDALAVAIELGIPFKVLDFEKEYRKKVIDYFYSEYKAGRTPNPDIVCNKEIKFGSFLQWALRSGFDYVATGHYARTVLSGKKGQSFKLLRGVDENKDQSYFLYQLTQKQLKHTLFPVGGMTKSEVRKKAKELKLCVADKPDSMGICFIGDIKLKDFLKKRIKEKTGEVIDLSGQVIGEHKGVWFSTIGQRHGFTITQRIKSEMPPLYVLGKDVINNRLIVGERPEAMRKEFIAADLHWISPRGKVKEMTAEELLIRIRHQGVLSRGSVQVLGSQAKVRLYKSNFAIASGQAAVFYQSEECLGGGIIK